MSTHDETLAALFQEEANDSLSRLSRRLLALEAADGTPGSAASSEEALRELFRLAHTMKGAASAAGRPDFAQVAHSLETLLDAIRRGQQRAGRSQIDAALTAVDVLQQGIAQALAPEQVASICARIDAASSADPGVAPAPPAGSPVPGTGADLAAQVNALPGVVVQLQHGTPEALAAARRTLEALTTAGRERSRRLARTLLEALARVGGERPQSAFLSAALMAADLFQTELLSEASDAELAAVEAALAVATPAAVSAPAAPAATAPAAPAATASAAPHRAEQSIRVPQAVVDGLSFRLEELALVRLRLSRQARTVDDLQDGLTDLQSLAATQPAARSVIDALRTRLQTLHRELSEDSHNVGLLTQAMLDDVREVRMVPLEPLFDGFQRLVRDLAVSLGKEAFLETAGGDVRVDRRLVEGLREALIHLLRNAVDHGIEAPGVRREAGKSGRGRVRLTAEARDGHARVEVSDDGRGIDPVKVRAAAVAKRLIPADRAEALSDRESIDLLFLSGFSTAATVTETSGRGVGLDVVRERITSLGGQIDVSARPGQGAQFVLTIPLTLSSSVGLLVRAGKQGYCVPMNAVQSVVALEPDAVSLAHGRLMVRRSGGPVGYVHLDSLLRRQPTAKPTQHVLGVELAISERRVVVGIEAVDGHEDVVVKALSPGTPRIRFIAGASLLSDGRLVPVLDPGSLIDAAIGGSASMASASGPVSRSAVVADDSITTRTMVASVLERAGYKVLTAPDGEAAFALLRQNQVDLLVSDVEMPLLDGLGLVRRVRATPELARLPVVLITSLGSSQDLERGAEAGANGYVVKKNFDPAAFLAQVAELLGTGGSA